jgi:hypothetical protein
MYLNYSSAQNYVRTLTQGVSLADSRKIIGAYNRSTAQTVRGTTVITRFEEYCRNITQTVKGAMNMKASPGFIRKVIQEAGIGDSGQRVLFILRKPTQTAGITSGTERITQAKRAIADTGKAGTEIGRKQGYMRNIAHTGNAGAGVLQKADYVKRFEEWAGSTAQAGTVRYAVLKLIEAVAGLYNLQAGAGFNREMRDTAGVGSAVGRAIKILRTLFGFARSGDSTVSFITRMRTIQDRETIGDRTDLTAEYLRGLFIEAGVMAEPKQTAAYKREVMDYTDVSAVPLRHLFIVIRLLTGAYIRDYIIGRFLKSREELVIKSPVVRELILESRVQ